MGFGILFVILCVLIIPNIRIVHQQTTVIIERLGKFHAEWDAGFHVKVPIIDTVRATISMKEDTFDTAPERMMTKDNISVSVDSVIYYKVTDPKLYFYAVKNPVVAIQNLVGPTLRSVVGDKTFDELLNSRDVINSIMTEKIDTITDEWGVKVRSVEIKSIIPPKDVEETMQKQMTAERNKRATILDAQAHKESVVATAAGDKEAKILAAQAEADSIRIKAEAEANAIKMKYQAEAEGLSSISEILGKSGALALKSYEALVSAADGNATKIYIPSNMTDNLVGAGIIGEAFNERTPMNNKAKPMPKPYTDNCQTQNHAHKEDAAASNAYMNSVPQRPSHTVDASVSPARNVSPTARV